MCREYFCFALILFFATQNTTSAFEPPDIRKLVTDLESDDQDKQLESIIKLGQIGEDARVAIPQLNKMMQSENSVLKFAALRTVWKIQGKSNTQLSVLVSSLNDTKPYSREQAIRLIGELGPEAATAVPSLINALKDKSADVRVQAALTLGEIGPKAKSAIPHLIKALEDQSSGTSKSSWGSLTVSDSASLGLRGIGPEVIPAIAPLLKHENNEIRKNAIWALVGGEHASKPHVATLIEAFDDNDASVRRTAIRVLGELKISSEQSVPALTKLLTDKDDSIRYFAAISIGEYGTMAKSAVPNLIAALSDEEPGVRATAAYALGEIGPDAKEAIPDLKRLRADRAEYFIELPGGRGTVAPVASDAIEKISVK